MNNERQTTMFYAYGIVLFNANYREFNANFRKLIQFMLSLSKYLGQTTWMHADMNEHTSKQVKIYENSSLIYGNSRLKTKQKTNYEGKQIDMGGDSANNSSSHLSRTDSPRHHQLHPYIPSTGILK